MLPQNQPQIQAFNSGGQTLSAKPEPITEKMQVQKSPQKKVEPATVNVTNNFNFN
jgi:hypothetical protein